MITRLAPTPSGFLHRGNLFNFLLTWLWARANRGQVLLRMDDADAERKRPEYLSDIFRVLEKAGLDWDIGPAGPDDVERHWSQQHRRDLYENALMEFRHQHLLFACACSRRTSDKHRTCTCASQRLPLDQPGLSWKLHVEPGATATLQDKEQGTVQQPITAFILRRRDGIPSYQLTSVIDDRYYQVTHIVRGLDLLDSSFRQVYLDQRLPTPWLTQALFWHHPLLLHPDGRKWSKSAGHQAQSLIGQFDFSALPRLFAEWMGWDPAPYGNLADLLAHPDLRLPPLRSSAH